MSPDPHRPEHQPPVTPCIGICRLDAEGLCVGCRRTLAEIARWGTMDDAERRRWIAEVQPVRRAARP
jgi:predicted Fe-S protein YdhL (DUF1289 family)